MNLANLLDQEVYRDVRQAFCDDREKCFMLVVSEMNGLIATAAALQSAESTPNIIMDLIWNGTVQVILKPGMEAPAINKNLTLPIDGIHEDRLVRFLDLGSVFVMKPLKQFRRNHAC